MKPYQLNIPTTVYYGRNIWKEALKEQKDRFAGSVMLVTTGRSLARLGYVEELRQQIQKNTDAEKIIQFDSVSANPRLSEIKEGIRLGRMENVKTIIGFGGGSAIDAAKAIAAGIGEREEIETLFYQGKEPGENTLPIIAIPTTAGTGSELSKAAIITDEHNKKKKGIRGSALYPKAAIVDAVFTETVPYTITMETGFDVLAHGIETYLSRAATPFTKMQSEYAIRITGQSLSALSNDLHDTQARERMAFASMIMGINLGNASTCLPHRMQYPLGAYTDTSHGVGLAALYPAWIKEEYNYVPGEIEKIMELLTGRTIHGKEACVETIRMFIKRIGLPACLSELGIEKSLLKVMATEVEGNLKNDPAVQGENGEILLKLYEAAWQ